MCYAPARPFLLMAAVGIWLGASGEVRAAIITYNFKFDNKSTLGNVISGSFTYDSLDAKPYAVTSITVRGFAGSQTEENPSLLTFDGVSLSGAYVFTSDLGGIGNLGVIESVGFAPSPTGPTGDITYEFYAFGVQVSTDSVGGPVTITPALVAPEPSSLALCGTAGAIGLVLARRRRRQDQRSTALYSVLERRKPILR